ncbi:MAG: hypothetical protein HGB11_08590, partial [Chlorobiales bacterium]|nr:hypothetical protein [Chlorobiales bacterium]
MNTRKLVGLLTFLILISFSSLTKAQEVKPQLQTAPAKEIAAKEESKPSVKFGALLQVQAQAFQEAITAARQDTASRHWGHQVQFRRLKTT